MGHSQPGAAAEQPFAEDPCRCLPNFWQPRHRRDVKAVSTSVIARFGRLCLRLLHLCLLCLATFPRAHCAASAPPRRVNSSRAQSQHHKAPTAPIHRAPWRPLAASDSKTKTARTSPCSVPSTTARLAAPLPASSGALVQAHPPLELPPPRARRMPSAPLRQALQAGCLAEVLPSAAASPAQAELHPHRSVEEVKLLAAT
jgi:hypothetical protein